MAKKISEVKRRKSKVQESSIEKKDQRWHCRNRLSLVFGSNEIEELNTYIYNDKDEVEFQVIDFHQAKSKAIEELLDNCIDEFLRGFVSEVHVDLSKDGKTITVEDNGVGFPLSKIESVYTEFRTGSKFKDAETDKKGFLFRTLGQNGVGASATCLTADLFKVTVRHYNTKKEQTWTFIDGALKRKKTKPKKFRGASGVKLEVKLSEEVYKDNIIDEDLLKKRIIDLAYNNPGLKIYFNGELHCYKKGLMEISSRLPQGESQIFGDKAYIYKDVNKKTKKPFKAQVDIALNLNFDKKSRDREKFISFVNSTPTYDGGFHHDRIKRLFINSVKQKLDRIARKEKIELNDNDILVGYTLMLSIIMPNARFESQTKRKLVRDKYLDKAIQDFVTEHIDKYLRKNKEYLDLVIERAKFRNRDSMLKEAAKLSKKQKKVKVEKLLDANERKDRSNCVLFICEGDSAISGFRSARDRDLHGGIPLKGKPMNVTQASIGDIIKNQEFADIMHSIGLTIGETPNPEKLRYSKIVFLADSDVDGGHINTLLINFFYSFWKELFEEGRIFIAKAPLYEVITTQGKAIYAESIEDLERVKADKRLKIKEIHRNKGLGEMSKDAYKYVIRDAVWSKISIENKSESDDILDVCFAKSAERRKELMMADGHNVKGYSAKKKTKRKTKKKVAKKVTKKKTKRSKK